MRDHFFRVQLAPIFIFKYLFLLFPFQGPAQNLLPQQLPGDILISREAYTVDYSPAHRQARWNYYIITRHRMYGTAKRRSTFLKDPKLSPAQACRATDYKGSGCDRGHLAPAEDMSYSNSAMNESFYFSNVSPQNPGFNRGIWKRLEMQVRSWKPIADTLHVITAGSVHDKLPKLKGSVTIPDKFYKIVLAKDTRGKVKAIAFLMPNKASKAPLRNYLVTIDELERLTKIDFCFLLPDDVEEALESSKADLFFWRIN